MVTETCEWRSVQVREKGKMYTEALVEHRVAQQPEQSSVRVEVRYPDGFVHVPVDMARGVNEDCRWYDDSFLVASSGAPYVGHGDGTAVITITYEPKCERPNPQQQPAAGIASERTWDDVKRPRTWGDL